MGSLPLERPRLRGVSHQLFFFVAVIAGALLVHSAKGATARWAALIYATSLAALLGISAAYHRISWRPGPRAWMRRLDHSAIFILIAGTYTPLCFALTEQRAMALALIWGAAAIGMVKSLLWPMAPKWLMPLLAVAMGWGGLYLVPAIESHAGPSGLTLILVGGVLYSAGAAVYALKRPDPVPKVFGYHEVFHALVLVAAFLHFVAMYNVVLSL